MAVKAQIVKLLLEQLSSKINVELDFGGFGKMSEHIDPDLISQKFLDDTYRRARKAVEGGKDTIGTHESRLNMIAQALGFKSYQDFDNKSSKPLDPLLASCLGNWWSIVRSNIGESIYKAPVRIHENNSEGVIMTLRGKENVFKGTVSVRAGCIFCELSSGKEKKLYIILKGNINSQFQALHGTFAGISSTGVPIGGRELFLREPNLNFSDMKWIKLSIDDGSIDKLIYQYFEKTEDNIIRANSQIDFG